MSVQIAIRHMTVSQESRQIVCDLCDEMQNIFGHIQNINVTIEDITGPHKAGLDKRCHLKVRGKKHLAIDIDATDEDLDCAIDNAFLHLKQALKRCHPSQICRRLRNSHSDSLPGPGTRFMI